MKIREIQLQTHKLAELKSFYSETLGLPVVREGRGSFVLQAGTSRMKFYKAEAREEPFYHFAFNIPENRLADAKSWLRERVTLLEKDGKDEFHFESWNAHAVYFLDPAGNIVELIARHNLRNASGAPFGSESLLCISEIGYPAENVRLFSEHVRLELNLKLYSGDERQFAAVGDEDGMFIIVPIERPWFPLDKPAMNYPITVDVE